jgi:sugar-specific transcriptional regulator TrmB/DNA-binding CsgD family transcriptional regulator
MSGEPALLEGLGLTPQEERVYVALLEIGGGPIAEAARAATLPRRDAEVALASLEAKGLAGRSADRKVRYLGVPPDIALDMLLTRQREALQRARLAADEFTKRFHETAHRSLGEIVEIVSGRDAIAHRFFQLQRVAEREVLIFDTPPYIASPGVNPVELDQLAKGVGYRSLYDAAALEIPDRLESIRELTRAGEEARTLGGLPLKVAIADRRMALVPLAVKEEFRADEALLVHPCSLLDALRTLFETLWERAIPMEFDRTSPQGSADLSDADRETLTLLAAGIKDESIALQLGVSARTIERRVARLMTLASVKTRFQLGLHAALHDWI